MGVQSPYKNIFGLLILFTIGSLISLVILQETKDIKEYYFNLHDRFKIFLQGKLEFEKPFPLNSLNKLSEGKTSIYVLGGNQDSLIHRFREASYLYHKGISNKIFILSRPGITEYDNDLGRNLTNNEWAIKELEKLNVKKEDIEPVPVQASFFGTLNEADVLPDIVRNKGYEKLILVTSAYHTMRTFTVFSKFVSNGSVDLYIYGSDDIPGLHCLLVEYMKLLLYEKIAIPVYGRKNRLNPGQVAVGS